MDVDPRGHELPVAAVVVVHADAHDPIGRLLALFPEKRDAAPAAIEVAPDAHEVVVPKIHGRIGRIEGRLEREVATVGDRERADHVGHGDRDPSVGDIVVERMDYLRVRIGHLLARQRTRPGREVDEDGQHTLRAENRAGFRLGARLHLPLGRQAAGEVVLDHGRSEGDAGEEQQAEEREPPHGACPQKAYPS